jgi:hypothetical protein
MVLGICVALVMIVNGSIGAPAATRACVSEKTHPAAQAISSAVTLAANNLVWVISLLPRTTVCL